MYRLIITTLIQTNVKLNLFIVDLTTLSVALTAVVPPGCDIVSCQVRKLFLMDYSRTHPRSIFQTLGH